jgi:hypothetical protein
VFKVPRSPCFPSPYPVIQVFVYTGRSHGLKARHSEQSILDSNQASRQVYLSTTEIQSGKSDRRRTGIQKPKVAQRLAPEQRPEIKVEKRLNLGHRSHWERSTVENYHENREFEIMLNLIIKGLKSRSPK